MENKFKKGLILGGLLAAGAAIGIALGKGGQELTKELQKELNVLSKHLKISLHQLQDVHQEGFNDLVKSVVEEYAKKKELASDAKTALILALQSKWQEMEEEYLNEEAKAR
ncbi:TPA: hypothetical protein DEB00_03095 [Candidatus Uhrbacteria bacterium]|nr:hypothetical protein [Candidatus Uhrbacteria bacterium]